MTSELFTRIGFVPSHRGSRCSARRRIERCRRGAAGASSVMMIAAQARLRCRLEEGDCLGRRSGEADGSFGSGGAGDEGFAG